MVYPPSTTPLMLPPAFNADISIGNESGYIKVRETRSTILRPTQPTTTGSTPVFAWLDLGRRVRSFTELVVCTTLAALILFLGVGCAGTPTAPDPGLSAEPPPASVPAAPQGETNAQQSEATTEQSAAPRSEYDLVRDALLKGRLWLDLRYRLAFVDEEGFDKDAWASTLRTVLGYESQPWHGLKALLEFENVTIYFKAL